MKKKIITVILTLAMLLGLSLTVSAGNVLPPIDILTNPFTDVPEGTWYTEACLWCNNEGYITGLNATTFEPNGKLTRAQFVQILIRVDGSASKSITYTGKFSDVKADDWYAKAIQWAIDCDITNGTSATTFSPNTPVTREQLCKFFMSYAKYKNYDTSKSSDLSGYDDADKISSWAVNSVKWAVAEGLISGTNPFTLSPGGTALRSQAAVIFKNFAENYVSNQK